MKKAMMVSYVIAAILSVTLFAAGPALAYFRAIPPLAGFGLFALGGLLGIFVTIGGAIAMIRGNTGAVVGVWFMGAVPAGFLIFGIVQGRGYPLINDISTELVYPPKFVQVQQMPELKDWDMSFPAGNAELITQKYPEIKALPLSGTLEDVFDRANQLASGEPGWTIVGSGTEEKGRTIEGYAETGVFHFRDYFIIQIREMDGGAVVVNMRSKSKDGRGDFGVNADRIHGFFEKLKA